MEKSIIFFEMLIFKPEFKIRNRFLGFIVYLYAYPHAHSPMCLLTISRTTTTMADEEALELVGKE